MTKENAIIAVFDTHDKAEQVVKNLQRSGFDMKKLSIVGKGYSTEEQPIYLGGALMRLDWYSSNRGPRPGLLTAEEIKKTTQALKGDALAKQDAVKPTVDR